MSFDDDTVVLLYDIWITSDREIATIWKRRFSGVTFIFLSIRYVTLISQIAWMTFSVSPGVFLSCRATGLIYYSASVWSGITFAVFSAFRTWAIWGRHWIPLAIVLPIGLVSPTLILYQYTFLHILPTPGPVPLGGCVSFPSLPVDTLTRLIIAARASALVADASVVFATWIKMWSIHRIVKSTNINVGKSSVSLSGLLLRDGTVYFIALLLLNISCLILDTTPQEFMNPIPFLTDSLTAILLCRLILNLRSFNMDNESIVNTNARPVSSVRFANAVLDNIGAPISFDESDVEGSTDYESSGSGEVSATWSEVVSNPLAIGLEDDIRRMRHEATNDETLEERKDGGLA